MGGTDSGTVPGGEGSFLLQAVGRDTQRFDRPRIAWQDIQRDARRLRSLRNPIHVTLRLYLEEGDAIYDKVGAAGPEDAGLHGAAGMVQQKAEGTVLAEGQIICGEFA